MSARKALPFMRLFSADYRRDTRHLTTEQHGAYLLILMAYWEQQGPLPEAHIERATELSPKAWQAHRDTLAEFFTVNRFGAWRHKRVEKELAAIRATSAKRVKAGREGGKAKAKNAADSSGRVASATAGLEPGNADRDVKGDEPSAVTFSHSTPPVMAATQVQQLTPAEDRLDEGRALVARLEALARADTSVPATITRLRPLRRSGT